MVFPNPSNGIFTLSGLGQDAHVAIYDARGKALQDATLSTTGRIDLVGKPAGIYYLMISSKSEVLYRKLVLK